MQQRSFCILVNTRQNYPVADLGEGGCPPPYFGQKEEMTEGKKAPPPLLAQGLDPPLLPVVEHQHGGYSNMETSMRSHGSQELISVWFQFLFCSVSNEF